MIVVSDTSAILNLARIGRMELLPKLYQQVLIPSAVSAELATFGVNPAFDLAYGTWLQVAAPGDQSLIARLRDELDFGERRRTSSTRRNSSTPAPWWASPWSVGEASEGEDKFIALPGDDVMLTTVTVGQPPKESSDHFTIVDLYESKMSEYDSQFVFVPIRKLQELRGMIDPTTGIGRVNVIQIELEPGTDGDAVRDKLQAKFSPALYEVYTWRDQQGALLAAVQMESAILNVLLFLIIAVAGFGILAIFYMIVVEKTRDIGILKSLGTSGRGVMGIFLAYGLSLGMVGSGVGMTAGLL